MLKRNNIVLGVFVGMIFPALSWLLFNYWYKGVVFFNKPAVPYFAAVLINLVLLRYFGKQNALKTSQGIMLSTFIFMILIFLIKLKI